MSLILVSLKSGIVRRLALRRSSHRVERNLATMSSKLIPAKEMTEDERYLFDLNGYLVVRNVLTPEEIGDANAAIDKRAASMVERSDGALRNAVKGTKLYGSGPGRKDLGGVLEWGPESKVFKSILAHPRLVPM